MSFKPSTIQAGTSAVATFEENGVHKHAESIQTYHRFNHSPNLNSGQTVMFKMPDNMEIVSFWASPNDTVTQNSSLEFTVADTYGSELINWNVKINDLLKGDKISWLLPCVLVDRDGSVIIRSNIALGNVTIVTKVVDLKPINNGLFLG